MALIAQGILKAHWDQSVPVNLARIAKAMQLVVALGDTGGACAILDITPKRKASVTIGRKHPITLQRYAVAHAIAHLALHHLRPGMQRAIHISESFHANHDQPQDSEANDFALELLIPEPVLRYTLEGQHARTLQELAHLFEVPEILIKQRLADLNLPLPQPLAERLKSSIAWD